MLHSVHRDWPRNKAVKHRMHSETYGTFCQVLGKRDFLSPKTAKFGGYMYPVTWLHFGQLPGGSPHIVVKNAENRRK